MKKSILFLAFFFCISVAQAQTNILANYNGDFESGLTNWRFFEVPNSIGSTAVITSTAISGTKAVKVTNVAIDGTVADRGFDNWNAHPPVTGGEVYNLKAFLRSDHFTGLTAEILLGFFDAGGAVVGQQSSFVSLTSTYTEYSIQEVAPTNATSCFIAFRLRNATGLLAGSLYIDNVQLYHQKSLDEISTDAHSGNYAAKITWGMDSLISDIVFDQLATVSPGVTYTYKAWAKSLSDPFVLEVYATFMDATENIKMEVADQSWVLTNEYTEHSYILPTTPNGTTKVEIGFRALNVNGTRWPSTTVASLIDDVQLVIQPAGETNIASINTITSLNTIKCILFPNPATSITNIVSDKSIKSASIYSLTGQKVKDIRGDFSNINVSNLSSGIYSVKMLTEGGESTQELVVK
jgi:hypothetical protein